MRKNKRIRRMNKGMALILAGILAAQSTTYAMAAEEESDMPVIEAADRMVQEESDEEIVVESENLKEPDILVEDEMSQEQPADILLDENIFPDENLRKAVGEMVDENQNGLLEESEYTGVKSLNLVYRGIRSLKGLEVFPNLEEMDCSWNHLTREEVEPFLGLEKLTYYNNTSLVEKPEEEVLETILLKEDNVSQNFEDQELVPEEEADVQESPMEEAKEDLQEPVIEEEEENTRELPAKEVEEEEENPQELSIEDAEENLQEPSMEEEKEGAKESSIEIEEENTRELRIADEVQGEAAADISPEVISQEVFLEPVIEEEITADDLEKQEEDLQEEEDTAGETAAKEDNLGEERWRFTFLSVVSSEEVEEVPLDEVHFPDVVFREFLADTYDRDGDLILSWEEVQVITALYVRELNTADLTGIGYFKNLLLLDATANQLQFLETQELERIHGLYCRENLLTRLDLTYNGELLQLECDENVEVTGWEDRGRPKSKYGALRQKTKAVTVGKTAVTKLTNTSKGKLKVTYKKVTGASGYEVQISKDKKFKSSVRQFNVTITSYEISRLYDEWIYYVRVRAYKLEGSKKVYGAFSGVKVHRMKNGLIIVNPSLKAAPLKSVSLISKKTVRVKATAPNVVRSEDKYYYLFNMTPTESKLPPTRKPIAKKTKATNITFDVPVKYNSTDSRLFYQYAIGVRTGKNKYQLVSGMKFISNPEKLAISNRAFPKASTKKGLQVNEFYISDAVSLGVKHTTYNMCLDDMIAKDNQKNNAQGISFSYNGKTYWFSKGVIQSYDARLDTYKKNNMIVSAIILLRYRSDLTYLMPTGYYQGGFYGLNVTKKAAREQLEAAFTFLARRYATDGRIANWIIGNEVNNYTTYHYTGSKSLAKNAKIYADSFRVAYIAIRSVYSKARLYISLDHLWNTVTSTGHASKAFLNKFAANWKSYGNFNIAYHPYPSPLTAPEFWNNTNNQINNSSNSPCVNMGNLKVLTNYVKSKFGSSTRIILSEQGFTSYKYGATVEKNQAAAIAYAYYLAEFNSMVDAFILHRHIDHQAEINQGLALGLWTNKSGTIETPGRKKYAWDVYKYVDTKKGASKTAFALPIIGKGSWKMAVPGYDSSRFS